MARERDKQHASVLFELTPNITLQNELVELEFSQQSPDEMEQVSSEHSPPELCPGVDDGGTDIAPPQASAAVKHPARVRSNIDMESPSARSADLPLRSSTSMTPRLARGGTVTFRSSNTPPKQPSASKRKNYGTPPHPCGGVSEFIRFEKELVSANDTWCGSRPYRCA